MTKKNVQLRKFVFKMTERSKSPKHPLGKGEQYDVLLSVWNVFRNKEQRIGFEEAGLRVHWVGNQFPPPLLGEVTKRSFDSLAFFLLFAQKLLFEWKGFIHLSMDAFDLFSGTRRLNTKLVWAYVEMNTRLIRRARRKGIPVVLDNPIAHMRCYYDILSEEFEELGMSFHPWFIKRWVRHAEDEYAHSDWFHVGSEFVKKTLVDRGISADRIIVNHTGVDLVRWRKCYENRRWNRDKIIFVYTGALIPRKGIQYLVKAWVEANLKNAELLICGAGDMPWNRICDTLPDSIKFFGRVSHDRLQEIYTSADVYVLPSLLEGFARSGLEAMASGLPIIVTEETGLTDMFDDGVEGWVVKSRSVDSIADRLKWCCEHTAEVKLAGEKAYSRMQGNDFQSYGKRCAAIARSIINKQDPLRE